MKNDERESVRSQRNTHAGAVGRASESGRELGVREEPEPRGAQRQASACSPLRTLSPILLAGRLRLAPTECVKGER